MKSTPYTPGEFSSASWDGWKIARIANGVPVCGEYVTSLPNAVSAALFRVFNKEAKSAIPQAFVPLTRTSGRKQIGSGLDCVCRSVPRPNFRGSCFAYSGSAIVLAVSLKSAGA